MANKKISQLTPKGSALAGTDLLEVSVFNGVTYDTKSLTGANVVSGLQPTLFSGTNIKTINSTSLLGSGDIVISTGLTVGTTPITSGTVGRVLFQGTGNVVQQDSTLFWDNTNKRLGVGATPSTAVRLDVRAQGALSSDITFRVRNSADSSNLQQFTGDGGWIHRNNAGSFYEYYDGLNTIEYRYPGVFNISTNNDVTSFRFSCNTGDVLLRGGSNILNIVNANNYHFEESTGTLPTSGAGAIVMKNRTAPSTNVQDRFYLYSADITAGNAAPHFRTENGNIIKIYRETTAVAAAAFVSNTSLIANDSATFGGYTMGQVVAALKAQGLLA